MISDVLPAGTEEAISKLRGDLRTAAATLTEAEARFLVDAYYIIQEDRKRSGNQVRALGEDGEPHGVLRWFFDNSRVLEGQIQAALDHYSNGKPLGVWARSHVGIGPVIAAGLLAHIDISRCTSAGDIWRFAGLDPTQKWEKGQKRPWNASLKVLCWKIGDSFCKFSNHERCYYGKVYRERKALEESRNAAGLLAEQAATALTAKKWGADTASYAAYTKGLLPPLQIDRRARRYAVKLFLAHYFEVGYEQLHGQRAPLPYPIAHLGHVDYIAPPNYER